nr:VOC family protein [Enterococcus ureasiticus]
MKQSIVHIALVVDDYDEAIAFYTQKLSFTLLEDTYQPDQKKDGLWYHRQIQKGQRFY